MELVVSSATLSPAVGRSSCLSVALTIGPPGYLFFPLVCLTNITRSLRMS